MNAQIIQKSNDGSCLEKAVFIPSGFSIGLPLIGVSGFKDEIDINFILYNDNRENVIKVKNKFKKILISTIKR